MNRALLYLWWTQRRNAVLRYLRRFTRLRDVPRALLPVAAGTLILFAVTKGTHVMAPREAAAFLGAALAAYLLIDLFGGFSDRGIAFRPAEVDFLFPGPFPRVGLVLYHLLTTYTRSLFAVALLFLLWGTHAASPVLALVGIAGAMFVGEHLRVIASLLSTQVAERTFRRLERPLRFVTIAVLLLLIFLFVPSLAEGGGLRGGLVRALESGPARVAFYPAASAAELSMSETAGEAILPLLGLLGCVLGTLVILLSLQVPFLEASIVTSQRRAALLARAKTGRRLAVDTRRPATPVRLPGGPIVRGAGAVFWRNLVVARRSGRALVFSSMFSMIFVLPAFLGMKKDPGFALLLGAVLPLMLSSTVSFDFRGETDQMEHLKMLPVSPARLALAEVAGSTIVALGFQTLLLAALVAFVGLDPLYALVALVAYVPVTAGLLAAANLAHLLAPRTGFLTMLLQVGFLVLDGFVLAIAFVAMQRVGVPAYGAYAVLFGLQVLVTALLLRVLGYAFARFDVTPT